MTFPYRPTPGGAARRWSARLAALLSLVPAGAAAQVLEGRVVLEGRGVAGAPVEVHRITPSDRGVIRTLQADAEGRFRAALPPADSGFTVVFATSVVNGVRHFGPALHGDSVPGEYLIQAHDTTSAAAAADSVTLVRRDVILAPAPDGGWEVAELVRVRNPTGRTLVPALEKPIVGFPLPEGSTAFEAGEGERQASADSSGPGEVVRVGGTAWVSAPLLPGERDFVFRYRLPATPQRVVLPLGMAADSLSVYVRQPAPDATVRGLPDAGTLAAEGESFRRYADADLAAGHEIVLDWQGPRPAPVDPRWAALAVAAAILAAGAWLAWRRS